MIAPTAALSSMPYTPTESMKALKFFYYKLGDKIWKEYGFIDAFSLHNLWFADSFLAIDQGPIIVMIENHRTGLLWNLFMSCPEVKTGMTKLGFTSPVSLISRFPCPVGARCWLRSVGAKHAREAFLNFIKRKFMINRAILFICLLYISLGGIAQKKTLPSNGSIYWHSRCLASSKVFRIPPCLMLSKNKPSAISGTLLTR